MDNGYDDIDVVKETLNDKKLKSIGIDKMGHRDKILLHINKLLQSNQTDKAKETKSSKSKSKSKSRSRSNKKSKSISKNIKSEIFESLLYTEWISTALQNYVNIIESKSLKQKKHESPTKPQKIFYAANWTLFRQKYQTIANKNLKKARNKWISMNDSEKKPWIDQGIEWKKKYKTKQKRAKKKAKRKPNRKRNRDKDEIDDNDGSDYEWKWTSKPFAKKRKIMHMDDVIIVKEEDDNSDMDLDSELSEKFEEFDMKIIIQNHPSILAKIRGYKLENRLLIEYISFGVHDTTYTATNCSPWPF